MNLQALLEKSAHDHHHLCPRQIIGVRMGLLGLQTLGYPERRPKRNSSTSSAKPTAVLWMA
jgi:formylmethanofuran dehydrogenase subunit E